MSCDISEIYHRVKISFHCTMGTCLKKTNRLFIVKIASIRDLSMYLCLFHRGICLKLKFSLKLFLCIINALDNLFLVGVCGS